MNNVYLAALNEPLSLINQLPVFEFENQNHYLKLMNKDWTFSKNFDISVDVREFLS